jgi:hypothetical protein
MCITVELSSNIDHNLSERLFGEAQIPRLQFVRHAGRRPHA